MFDPDFRKRGDLHDGDVGESRDEGEELELSFTKQVIFCFIVYYSNNSNNIYFGNLQALHLYSCNLFIYSFIPVWRRCN